MRAYRRLNSDIQSRHRQRSSSYVDSELRLLAYSVSFRPADEAAATRSSELRATNPPTINE